MTRVQLCDDDVTTSRCRRCRYHDVHVVVSTLSSRRRYNVVDRLWLSSGTSSTMTMTMTDDTDDVRRWMSDVVVFRCLSHCRSRNPSSCMRPRDYDVHVPACVSRLTLCLGVRLWLFIYDVVCPANFVTFVPASLSRHGCQ